MQYRNVGPIRGGRVTAVTGVEQQPYTFYMGSTGGGVWKTIDAGHSFINVSDGQIAVGSIGAMMVAPSDPNIIYVGTGSSKIRSNVSIGNGMYKSTDAGKTWTHIGLLVRRPDSGNRSVLTQPTQTSCMSRRREIPSKPTQSAVSTRRLMAAARHGSRCCTFLISPVPPILNSSPPIPNVLFACMPGMLCCYTLDHHLRRRGGWHLQEYQDSGEHWTKLCSGGLPNGRFGRSNVAVSNASPNRLYAIIEAKPGQGFYRSDDAGATWILVNHDNAISTRGFYYSTLGAADPNANGRRWPARRRNVVQVDRRRQDI